MWLGCWAGHRHLRLVPKICLLTHLIHPHLLPHALHLLLAVATVALDIIESLLKDLSVLPVDLLSLGDICDMTCCIRELVGGYADKVTGVIMIVDLSYSVHLTLEFLIGDVLLWYPDVGGLAHVWIVGFESSANISLRCE